MTTRGIGDVATALGLDADTLRWFERRGVVPAPPRDAAGRRAYGEDDVHLLEVLLHLRDTGMPLAQIAEFTALVARDPDGVPERLELLRAHRARVRAEQRRVAASLRVIDTKIDDYTARLAGDPVGGAVAPMSTARSIGAVRDCGRARPRSCGRRAGRPRG